MNVLVTGGAGYIGSHTAIELARQGHTPIVFDNLIYGHREFVKWGPFVEGNISETNLLTKTMEQFKIEAVLHFAAYAYVGESVQEPIKYYENNVLGTLSILNAMKAAKVSRIIFSSTCATYGIPESLPIEETTAQNPINPYGASKLMVEEILEEFVKAHQFTATALRYFNAAGCDADGEVGESHDPETHLIPLALKAASDENFRLKIFGLDYPTEDGSCVRDYIHVTDLASAHVLALEKMEAGTFKAYNLGTGKGFSVKEIVNSVESITGNKVKADYADRRAGDPPVLMATGNLAKKELGWSPSHSSIENIIKTANRWHLKSKGIN